ncbi:PAS domain-containing protein [Paenibacillus lautus]|uniref:PAS domain-containing protein n=1 Tax=Paenibacillus lautus TaxID=1401 RepID=UPI000FDC6220|nr:PAS domain-containing protein [Paenibacillus lautus]
MPYDTMITSWNNAVHSLNKGLMIITPDGIIDKINDPLITMAERYGVSPEFGWQGASFFNIASQPLSLASFDHFFHELDVPSIRDVMLGKQPDYSFEYAVQWNGQENWVLCEVLPLLINKDRRIHGAMISFTDITKFKRKELLLEQALAHSFPLPGHIPICAVCKYVHHAEEWEPVESYLESRLPIEFTHDICPDCIRRLYPKYSSILDDPELLD